MKIHEKYMKEKYALILESLHKSLVWLESFLDQQSISLTKPSNFSKRVFSREECDVLSFKSRRYLLILEQRGILTPTLREHIIHHAMLLDIKPIQQPIIEGMTRMLLGKDSNIIASLDHLNRLTPVNSYNIH